MNRSGPCSSETQGADSPTPAVPLCSLVKDTPLPGLAWEDSFPSGPTAEGMVDPRCSHLPSVGTLAWPFLTDT